jgi:hypothetical protein
VTLGDDALLGPCPFVLAGSHVAAGALHRARSVTTGSMSPSGGV